ncbi:DUF2813 domain-containing protein [Escherichia coli]
MGRTRAGKSSLLDALTLLLSPESDLYHFERDDFWFPPGDINGREHHLQINSPSANCCQADIGFAVIGRWKRRRTPCTDGYHRIFYRLEGESAEDWQRDDTAQFSR